MYVNTNGTVVGMEKRGTVYNKNKHTNNNSPTRQIEMNDSLTVNEFAGQNATLLSPMQYLHEFI